MHSAPTPSAGKSEGERRDRDLQLVALGGDLPVRFGTGTVAFGAAVTCAAALQRDVLPPTSASSVKSMSPSIGTGAMPGMSLIFATSLTSSPSSSR